MENIILLYYIILFIILIIIIWLSISLISKDKKRNKWLKDFNQWYYSFDQLILIIFSIISAIFLFFAFYYIELNVSDSNTLIVVRTMALVFTIFLALGFIFFFFFINPTVSIIFFIISFILIGVITIFFLPYFSNSSWYCIPMLILIAWILSSLSCNIFRKEIKTDLSV